MRDWAMKLPIRMKSGKTANSAFRIWPKASVPTAAIAGSNSRKCTRPRKPISAMPKAIGTSRKSRMKRATKAMATSSIAYDPALDDRSVWPSKFAAVPRMLITARSRKTTAVNAAKTLMP